MNKKELALLTKKWTDRLKEEGFHDIEQKRGANNSIDRIALEKVKNGDSLYIEAIHDQMLQFYQNNDFQVIYKRDIFPVALKKFFTASDIERIFLMWLEGETIRFISQFFLTHLSYEYIRDLIYLVLKAIFKYARFNKSKSLKAEALNFINEFSNGFGKRGGVGRGGKTTEKRQECKSCKNRFYAQEKNAAFDYCPDCIQIVEYARSGDQKEVKYILKSTGEVICTTIRYY